MALLSVVGLVLVLILGSTFLSVMASRLLSPEMAYMGASGLTLLTLIFAVCSYFALHGPPLEVSLLLGLLALGAWLGCGWEFLRLHQPAEPPGTGLTHSGSGK